MIRENKFKVWNGKRMIVWEEIWSGWNVCDLFGKQGIIPLEYTGLKDKNGKEIYEGDIVRIKQYNYDSEWRLCTLTLVSPITFTSDCQFFPTKLVNNRLWEPDTEVIGNIYENPELLEKK